MAKGSYFWDAAAKQFCSKIGYKLNASGQRVRDRQYLGSRKLAAKAQAAGLAAEWAEIKAKAKADGHKFPIWAYDEIQEGNKTDERFLEARDLPAWEKGQPQNLTIRQAMLQWFEHRQSLIGVADGLTRGSYQSSKDRLEIVLSILDLDQPLAALDDQALLDFKLAWMRKVKSNENPSGTLCKVTAVAYLKAFKTFLFWVHANSHIAYSHPNSFLSAFRFKKVTHIDIRPYSNDMIRDMLQAATERTRLYILLSLNCDATQIELATLRHEHLVLANNCLCVWRKRQKAHHLNDFNTLYCLWPETAGLLQKHLATTDTDANPYGFALLNDDGKPLISFKETEDANGDAEFSRSDNITCAFKRVLSKMKKQHYRYKDFRKTGANYMMQRYKDNGYTARLFAAQSIQGSLKQYAMDDFAPLTQALLQWHEELLVAGVFDCLKD